MGSRSIGVSIYVIISLSMIILLFPTEQANAVFFLPPEWTEEELLELFKQKQLLRVELQNEENFDFESYKQEQIFRAEQVRDQILDFKMTGLQNPYLDTPSNVIVSFEENNEVKSIKSLDRRNENFQLIKDEQLSIAEKKCKEILGGKTISNSINDEPLQKKTIHAFKIDNQTGFMNRNFEDFHNYKLLQISIVEDYRDNNWEENLWSSNPYQNNESIEELSNNKENKILEYVSDHRQSEEFKNLIIEQIFLAENIRNEMLDFRITAVQNSYLDEKIDENLDENIDENTDESLGKTNQNIAISWSDPTYVTDKLEFNILDRDTKVFEMVKAMEFEIAKIRLNEMIHLSNPEKSDVEIIILTNENKKLNNYERDDQGFEFFKNKSIDIAEKKLIEILGGKKIHNPDYLDFEIKKLYYSNLDKKE